jgi:4-amino-4-deoxy-L-arabinose transferase-like glycosyltransferase
VTRQSTLPSKPGESSPETNVLLVRHKPQILLVRRQEATSIQSLSVLIFVCSTAALLRLIVAGYFVYRYGAINIYGSFESCRIAASVVGGHGFSSPYGIPSGPTAWLPPVYPLIVAAVFKLLGVYSLASLWCLIALNIFFATLTTAVIYRVGTHYFGAMTGFVASMLWAMDIAAIAFSVRIWESSLSALLVTLALLLHLRLRESPARTRAWILYGLLWALAGLTNTALLTLMPLSVAELLHKRRRETGRRALVALVVFAAALLPWCIRNYVVFHKVIPLRSNFGPNLWYGNRPDVNGPVDQSLDPTHNPEELRTYIAMGDAGYSASRQQTAFDFIRQHPGQFARLTGARILYFWTASETFGPFWHTCASLLAYTGLFLIWRNGIAGVALFASALLLFPLPYYVTHSESFYRHPIEPLVGLLVAYACVTLFEMFRLPSWLKLRAQSASSPRTITAESAE